MASKRAAFHTLGCRVNQYETMALAELFVKKGFEIVDFDGDSDIYIINTCAVTAESGRKSAQLIRRAAKKGAVAVVGCYSQLLKSELAKTAGVNFISGNGNKSKVADLADGIIAGNKYISDFALDDPDIEPLEIGNVSSGLFSDCRAYIKIQDGCDYKCAYCVIPSVRGRSRSRSPADIISEARRLAEAGYKELVLTGIETGAYSGAPLPELIREAGKIKGLTRLRTGSLSPNCLSADFLRAAAETEIFMPHLHISVQSGSDRILRLMRRPYSKQTLEDKLGGIKKFLPETLISADMITGFPGESEKDFDETLELAGKYKFSHIHAFPFSKRQGTAAAEMIEELNAAQKKRRNEILIKHGGIIKEEILGSKIGKTARVLVETVKNNYCAGHTADYLEMRIYGGKYKTGDETAVTVSGYENGVLYGGERND